MKNKTNYGKELLASVFPKKLDLIKKYLEPAGVTMEELMDRDIFTSLCQLLDAYLLEAVRNYTGEADKEEKKGYEISEKQIKKLVKYLTKKYSVNKEKIELITKIEKQL